VTAGPPAAPGLPAVSAATSSPGIPARPARLAAALLLVLFVALCAHGLRWDTPTVDEFAHLPAGYYYLRTGNFELYNLNPPLPRMLCALPLLAAAPAIDIGARLRDTGWYPWIFATDFMRRNAARFDGLFLLGRLPVVALGVLLGLLVWRWARQLYGEEAGLVALLAYAGCPSIVAHAHLATTDLAFALATAGALYTAARCLRQPRPATLLAAGVALGLAQLAKFTAVLLYPILLCLALAALLRGVRGRGLAPRSTPGEAQARPRFISDLLWSLAALAAAGLLSLLVLDAGYLFHGVGQAVASFRFRSRLLHGLAAALPGGLPLPLPAAWLHGFDSIQLINEQGEFPTFFFGRWLPRGTWLYYPATLLLKTPLPLLAAWLVAPLARLAPRSASGGDRRWEEAFLWFPCLVMLAVFSLGSSVSYGIRYLLPVLPLACIYAARLVPWLRSLRPPASPPHAARGAGSGGGAVGAGDVKAADGAKHSPGAGAAARIVHAAGLALLLAYPASVLLATPNTIDYFNLLAGDRPDDLLLDSNLDWGQGLERLRVWLDRRNLPAIPLAYFGHVDPALYGIRWAFPARDRPGPVAVSANFLHGYPYVTNRAGRMLPIPPDAFTWLAGRRRIANLGGGMFIYEGAAGSR
jgi:hypothetical protein